jgi:hypothetical protein
MCYCVGLVSSFSESTLILFLVHIFLHDYNNVVRLKRVPDCRLPPCRDTRSSLFHLSNIHSFLQMCRVLTNLPSHTRVRAVTFRSDAFVNLILGGLYGRARLHVVLHVYCPLHYYLH